ncbi:MAG: DHH family phosphoesterase, partial [Phycisphaerae bacterium]
LIAADSLTRAAIKLIIEFMVKKIFQLIESFTASDKTEKNLKKLTEILKSSTRLLIVMQDNPDPDAIGAAVALRKLANSIADIRCSLAHGGTIGRGENRALVKYLGLSLHSVADTEFDKFSTIALVDTQPGTGNNSLPAGMIPDIIIDHHGCKQFSSSAKFYDIRPNYGATSTIMLEYMAAAGIEPDIPLATALLYAIRSDTQDLGREAKYPDVQAVAYLYPLANKKMLGEIQRGNVPREYFQILTRAIKNAAIHGNSIISHLGEVSNPDMIAEVADLLLREETAEWTMCTGVYNDKMLISLRTHEEKNRADSAVKRIVSRKGTGGGHKTYAGGQIPLAAEVSDKIKKHLEHTVQKRFLKTIGCTQQPAVKLIN